MTHPDDVRTWLQEGHRRFREHVATLKDADLPVLRKATWGGEYETGWLINVIIQHDLYHAGEINHLRALRQDDDGFPY